MRIHHTLLPQEGSPLLVSMLAKETGNDETMTPDIPFLPPSSFSSVFLPPCVPGPFEFFTTLAQSPIRAPDPGPPTDPLDALGLDSFGSLDSLDSRSVFESLVSADTGAEVTPFFLPTERKMPALSTARLTHPSTPKN